MKVNQEFLKFIINSNQLIFVGLGNITSRYENTRHNVGFDFIENMITSFNLSQLKVDTKLDCYYNKYQINNKSIILIKPTTFMNNSGIAVSKALSYYKLDHKNLVVVHDDLDIKLGEIKINFEKGPKIHNGVNSVEQMLKTDDFWRIRIGVESRNSVNEKNIPGRNYVLMKLNQKEQNTISTSLTEIIETIKKLYS